MNYQNRITTSERTAAEATGGGNIYVSSFVDVLCFFSILCLLLLCTHLFICALWSTAGKGLTSWLSFVVSNCELVTFPLVSWVRCGT